MALPFGAAAAAAAETMAEISAAEVLRTSPLSCAEKTGKKNILCYTVRRTAGL